jgi:hypothetical protein
MIFMKLIRGCHSILLLSSLNCAYLLDGFKSGAGTPPSGTVSKKYPNSKTKKLLLNENWVEPRQQYRLYKFGICCIK